CVFGVGLRREREELRLPPLRLQRDVGFVLLFEPLLLAVRALRLALLPLPVGHLAEVTLLEIVGVTLLGLALALRLLVAPACSLLVDERRLLATPGVVVGDVLVASLLPRGGRL